MRKPKKFNIRVGNKTPLIFLFVIFLLSSLFIFRSTAAGPTKKINENHPTSSYTVIPVSKPIDQSSKNTSSSSRVLSDSYSLAPSHIGMNASNDPQLQKLATYENSVGGAVASGIMYFTRYSDSTSSAVGDATAMYSTLKEFAKYGIKPLIIMEPTNSNGSLNFASYRNGAYDNLLDTYFQKLKILGISDKEMGIWTYFPEANLPQWGPVDIVDFGPNVTRTINIQKKYFPNSLSSIMLDAASYPAGSTSWGNGSYVSLAPFMFGIPYGLVDSFGLQGFPWAPPANRTDQAPSYNPAIYLKGSLAVEAANILGAHDVWLNTGTFAAMYANNPSQTVFLSSSQRQAMLTGVLNQALAIRKSGYNVAVNSFNEDKSSTTMAVDRSYKSASDQAVFNNFVSQLNANGIDSWIFDK